jgi:sigma-E factor negative regulatory protein RseB
MTMRNRYLLANLVGTLLGAVAILCSGVANAEENARDWLMRMSRVLAMRSYDGQFLHLHGGRTENMRLVHRYDNGEVTERLVSLDGSGRELVRTNTQVIYYLPDQRTVLVERRSDSSSLVANVPLYSERLSAYYNLAAPRAGRVLGRSAQLITIEPHDHLRYGYHLWLDQTTAMPLKSELRDSQGRVIEQMVFSELRLLSKVDPKTLEPSVVTEGFRWLHKDVHARSFNIGPHGRVAGWTVVNPPTGFTLTASQEQQVDGSTAMVRQMVFSDGLASVSVFIESKSQPRPSPPGLAKLGTSNAYGVDAADHWVTAVGEVPETTVEALARSVRLERQASVSK